jgi:CheY-like chemotaxis protein
MVHGILEARSEGGKGMPTPMATILLIDDEEQVRMRFQIALEGAGYRVLTAENGKHGMRLLERQEVDVILVDIFMPDMDGLELIPPFRKERPAIKIIAISGGSDKENYLDVAKLLGGERHPQEAVQCPRVAGCGRISIEMSTSARARPAPHKTSRSRLTPDLPPSCNGGA